jgi:NADH:ubiquinone oxidoreductase subunit F (NADH-binding)
MTAMLAPTRTGDAAVGAAAIGSPRLLNGLDRHGVLDHQTHLQVHGPLPATDLPRLLAHLEAVGLCGRGGAGFPFAAKLRAVSGRRPHVIVNGTESEPGSQKDRMLLNRTPHLVLDGALSIAAALDARAVTVAVHDETTAAAVRRAVAERRARTGGAVRVHIVPGGFVSGEARALARSIAGGPAVPPGRRDHLSGQGILLANAETFAQTAVLLRLGPQRFARTGTADQPGTVVLTVGGAVGRPGVLEAPAGVPLGVVLAAAGASPDLQAVVVGGYHGQWLAPDPSIRLSRSGVGAAGGTLGAGVVLALDQSTCGLGELARVARWLGAESAGQCGPCVFGLPSLADDVAALLHGDDSALADAPRHAWLVTGRGACAHPDGSARFVGSGLHLLHDEIHWHRAGGCGRPIMGQLPIGAVR